MMMKEALSGLAAVILAAGAMLARAEVTVFGHGDANQPESVPVSQNAADAASECAHCLFGIDGRNDMGNGLMAIYRMDWENADGKRESRDRWLGISGDFGQVKFGTLSTASKAEGVIPESAFRPSAMNASGLPSVPAGYDANVGGRADPDGGVGLSYENAGMLIFADYISGSDISGDDAAYNVGAKLATDHFSMFGQYRIGTGTAGRDLTGSALDSTNAWFLGGSLIVGETSIYAGYGRGDNRVNAGAVPGYDTWEIVGIHSLDKLTSIYAGYSGTGCLDKNADSCSKSDSDAIDEDRFSLGIRHNF
jgi:predicted porin